MPKSKYRIFFVVILSVLIIGVIIPGLTVRDAVSLTETEQECKRADFSILYDNPIERLGILFGKTAVIEKFPESERRGFVADGGNALRIKAYTLFRIPVGESIVGCGDSPSYKLPRTETGIKQAIEQARYCEAKSDCAQVQSKCPFGCYVFVNEKEVGRIQTFIDSYESRCIYLCVPLKDYDCINNKCEILLP